MDLVGLVSLATGIGLGAFGIYLSVKFYLETARMERSMVETLAKIEALSASNQQIQNEMIRAAWEKWVAPSRVLEAPEDEAQRREAAREDQDSPSMEDRVEQQPPQPQGRQDGTPKLDIYDYLATMGLRELLSLGVVLDSTDTLQRIVTVLSKERYTLTSPAWHDHTLDSRTLSRAQFEEGLRALQKEGLVQDVRQSDREYLVRLARDLVLFWGEVGTSRTRSLLSFGAQRALARQAFEHAKPVWPEPEQLPLDQ
jgi:hypothetical protein